MTDPTSEPGQRNPQDDLPDTDVEGHGGRLPRWTNPADGADDTAGHGGNFTGSAYPADDADDAAGHVAGGERGMETPI